MLIAAIHLMLQSISDIPPVWEMGAVVTVLFLFVLVIIGVGVAVWKLINKGAEQIEKMDTRHAATLENLGTKLETTAKIHADSQDRFGRRVERSTAMVAQLVSEQGRAMVDRNNPPVEP